MSAGRKSLRNLSQEQWHACTSQCDDCHTLENCVEATLRLADLILCAGCYEARQP